MTSRVSDRAGWRSALSWATSSSASPTSGTWALSRQEWSETLSAGCRQHPATGIRRGDSLVQFRYPAVQLARAASLVLVQLGSSGRGARSTGVARLGPA